MSVLSKLIRLHGLGEALVLIGRVLGALGNALTGRAPEVRDSEQDSLTHGVESEKPENDTQYDLFDESDSYESSRKGRSELRAQRHSPEPLD